MPGFPVVGATLESALIEPGFYPVDIKFGKEFGGNHEKAF
jgi:hypothetical protein